MTERTGAIHPAAIDHLPMFITPPGSTDVLFVGTAIFLVLFILGIGLVYFRLHALPEHLAHRGQKVQYQFVAVLTVLALFTHNHVFWVAALLLAFVQIPDFSTPLTTMARSLSKMAGLPDTGEARQPDHEAGEAEEETKARATSPASSHESPGSQAPRDRQGG